MIDWEKGELSCLHCDGNTWEEKLVPGLPEMLEERNIKAIQVYALECVHCKAHLMTTNQMQAFLDKCKEIVRKHDSGEVDE